MKKMTLLLLALSVSVLGVAEDSFAAETDFREAADRRSETEALATGTGGTTGKELNESIPGQFLPGTMTDFVKGAGFSARTASGVVWNGFVIGTGALAPREMQDVAVLPIRESRGKEAWNGYAAGSLNYWQRKP
ncbi:MAG: hypothetical protein EG824_12330 [Deltaproteobacteria bacterium]|nr:hypothetical protein [Deltaproteobacteria bacterium]